MILKIASMSFRNNFRKFKSMILAMAFSVAILYNFQFIVFSDSMAILQDWNKEFINIVVQIISIILIIFSLFYIWYTTNVFLTKRKKEIGIYIFMGFDNIQVGKLYAIETLFLGFISILIGLVCGVIFSKLFIMIMLKISTIDVSFAFSISLEAILFTLIVFACIFIFMAIKGYISIINSSVLDLIQANKITEFKIENRLLQAVKFVVGLVLGGLGFYYATQIGQLSSFTYMLVAVVCVIGGVYLSYNTVFPTLLSWLIRHKDIMYKNDRLIWINNLLFKIKQNYRTYAMVTVLMMSSFAVIGTAFALKNRTQTMNDFSNKYPYQIISTEKIDNRLIQGLKDIDTSFQHRLIVIDTDRVDTPYVNQTYAVLALSDFLDTVDQSMVTSLQDNEVIELNHPSLLHMVNFDANKTFTVDDEVYNVVESSSYPVLGSMQAQISAYVVNNKTFSDYLEKLPVLYLNSYTATSLEHYHENVSYLKSLESETLSTIIVDIEDKSDGWIRVLYALCIYLFLVLVAASASILFLKITEDAYHDKEQYRILSLLGMSSTTTKKSIKKEIRFAYYAPFVVTAVASIFIMIALGNLMRTTLFTINIIALLVVFIFYYVIYRISVIVFYAIMRE